MRILIAGTTYAPAINGQAIFMTNLAERLVARGHSVAVLAPSESGPTQETFANGVHVVRPRTQRLTYWHPNAVVSLFSGPVVENLITRFRPHVVHIQDHYPLSWSAVQVARRHRLPVIGTNHFMPENLAPYLPFWSISQSIYRNLLWRWMLHLYNTLDSVTVQSHRAGLILQEQGICRPMQLISCGVDLEKFYLDATVDQQAVRHRFGLNPTDLLLLYVGRVDHEKRLDVLIRALARSGNPTCQLAVAGQGAARTELEALVQELGLEDRVHFLGFISDADKRDLLNSADIFAMPSDAELLSIATLEAMACGRPILAARAQALPELVTDWENGRLFRPGDIDDAASALVDLASHPQDWPSMGAASRQRADAHGWTDVVKRYEYLFEEGIRQRSMVPSKSKQWNSNKTPAVKLFGETRSLSSETLSQKQSLAVHSDR